MIDWKEKRYVYLKASGSYSLKINNELSPFQLHMLTELGGYAYSPFS